MIRAILSAVFLLPLLASCSQSGGDDRAGDTAADERTYDESEVLLRPPYPSPKTLVGEYRVAGIDGDALDAAFGIALSIDDKSISFEPRCAGFAWDYSYRDGDIELTRAAPVNPPVGGVPAPVCTVAVAPELRALGQALDAVVSAGRTPENATLLFGGQHSVTLFSQ